MPLRKGDHGPAVLDLQQQLLALGYALPRWGADGQLGDETLDAAGHFLADHDPTEPTGQAARSGLSDAQLLEIADLYQRLPQAPRPAAMFDCTGLHSGEHRIRKRAWGEVTGITLHQTACDLGENPSRWYSVPVQMGCTRQGKILLLNPIEYLTWHGHGLNGADVGIECDGRYEGIEGDLSTYWKTPGHPELWTPERPTPELITSARETVKWICTEVARHGGKVRYIHAHRQASDQRRPDPGSRIWQDVGLWAQRELGLSDGGPGWHLGTGYLIPEAWDASRVGVKY